ncbi:MAG TPA: hypothetical protein VMB05_06715, partial [Solirubrobacteraceae bacterium]|nr:hypothetical protein [Solirubrobacteraceae bacterium]
MRAGTLRLARRLALALATLALLSGCAAANKEEAASTSMTSTSAMSSGDMAGMHMNANSGATGSSGA